MKYLIAVDLTPPFQFGPEIESKKHVSGHSLLCCVLLFFFTKTEFFGVCPPTNRVLMCLLKFYVGTGI